MIGKSIAWRIEMVDVVRLRVQRQHARLGKERLALQAHKPRLEPVADSHELWDGREAVAVVYLQRV